MTAVGIIGPGRAGVGVGLGLARAGLRVFVHGRTRRPLPPELKATWSGDGLPPWIGEAEILLLAVRDDAITGLARTLADSGKVTARQVVLHLSGVLDRSALLPLDASGAALGSFHPLQTFTDPESAVERLRGAVVTVEGDERAIEAAQALAAVLGMRPPVRLASSAKSRYHAGAVFASNYVVAVAEVARQILIDAGFPPGVAWPALQGLLRGTFESLQAGSPEDALTGPISRGDAATVRRHVALLSGEQAALYRALGRVALRLANIDDDRRREIEQILDSPTPNPAIPASRA